MVSRNAGARGVEVQGGQDGSQDSGQSLWDFFSDRFGSKESEEPEESPAPNGEGKPGHFGG